MPISSEDSDTTIKKSHQQYKLMAFLLNGFIVFKLRWHLQIHVVFQSGVRLFFYNFQKSGTL